VIPFVDLQAQYSQIREEIQEAIARVLESGRFVQGDEVRSFEEDFAAYCGVRYCVAVNSGSSALHLALLAAGIGAGDEVITVPFTFVATVAAIRYTGARPVFVDIDPVSFTMDVRQLRKAINNRTKAVLPVHLYGQPADMDVIVEIARTHGLLVIEDAAQAHGAEYKGRRAGAVGELGCFSFYPGKNLGAFGEGGLVSTSDSEYARTIRLLRDWGQEEKYSHVLQGYNYRMDELQAAILQVKLRHLEDWTEARRAHAARYGQLLSDSGVRIPEEMPYARHVYHIYAARVPERDAVQRELRADGIQTGIHYPVPVHLQPAHADLGYRRGQFPNSEEAAGQVLSLPMFPELTDSQIEQVARTLRLRVAARSSRAEPSGGARVR
jgi:dTDP-4-amino-4,6-dideoxygalactose transaminase